MLLVHVNVILDLRLILKIYTVYYHYKWPNLKIKVPYFCLCKRKRKRKIQNCIVQFELKYFFPQKRGRTFPYSRPEN